MISDDRANRLIDEVMDLVCPTLFDATSGFQSTGVWPGGKDQAWFEVRVWPAVVELVGGKEDGATGFGGFRADLKALQDAVFPLFDEIHEWELDSAVGHADDLPRPAITISGRLKGGDDTLTIHICTCPPADAEAAEKHRMRPVKHR